MENRGVDFPFIFFDEPPKKPKADKLDAFFPEGTPAGPGPSEAPKPLRPTTRARALHGEAEEAPDVVTLFVRAGKHPGKYTIPWSPQGDLNHYLNQAGIYADVVKSALRCYDSTNYSRGKLRPKYVPRAGAILEVVGPQASPIATRQPVQDKPVDQTIVAAVPIAGVRAGGPSRLVSSSTQGQKAKGLLGFEQESL